MASAKFKTLDGLENEEREDMISAACKTILLHRDTQRKKGKRSVAKDQQDLEQCKRDLTEAVLDWGQRPLPSSGARVLPVEIRRLLRSMHDLAQAAMVGTDKEYMKTSIQSIAAELSQKLRIEASDSIRQPVWYPKMHQEKDGMLRDLQVV